MKRDKIAQYETSDPGKAVRLTSLAVRTGAMLRHKTLVFGGRMVHQIETEQNVLAVFLRNEQANEDQKGWGVR